MQIKLNEEETVSALHLLWVHLQESESRAHNTVDVVLKRWVEQAYDFLNRIGYTNKRPRWEKHDEISNTGN